MPAIRKKTFPKEFELKKKVLFWPAFPARFEADILEIGPGNGDFLLSLAAQNPSKKIAAIEVREKRFSKIAKRLEKAGFTNVLLIRGNAKVIIPEVFKKAYLEKIYILFPDPWPKRRHTFHRLLDAPFLEILSASLKKNGQIILATDSKEYADWILKTAQEITSLKEGAFERDFHETFFEKVWKKEGKNISYLSFTKT